MIIHRYFVEGRIRIAAWCIAVTFSIIPIAYGQTESFEELDTYIETAMKDWGVPGLALAIVKDDRVIHSRGFGIRTLRTQEQVNEHTLFGIASNTKAFTATALGLLVQEGTISWDDPVVELMPDFQLHDPIATRKITIRDMLCHRSGLGLWTGDLTWWNSNYDSAEVIRRIRFQKPVSDLGTTYRYSNLMILVAGEVIPRVTGTSWHHFVEQRFFKPLHMNRSVTSVNDLEERDNVATPHAVVEGKIVPIEYLNTDNCAPATAIISSVHDLSQWVRLHLNEGTYQGQRLVNASIIRETQKPHTLIHVNEKTKARHPSIHFSAYGLGFRTLDYQGRLLVNHTGELDGMFSYVGFMPEENLGVIVLTNHEEHELHRALPYYVFDTLLGVDTKDWSKIYLNSFRQQRRQREELEQRRLKNKPQDTRTTLPLEAYAGTYVSEVYGTARITLEDGRLTLRLSAHPQFVATMGHWYYDTFLATWNHKLWKSSYVYFRLNGHGEITKFLMSVRPDWIDTHEYAFIKTR